LHKARNHMARQTTKRGNDVLLVDSDATYHAHYCHANVCIAVDYATGQTTVTATIGTAPNDSTVIVYPYHKTEFGYVNKTAARKLAAQLKHELRNYIKAKGIKLSEPMGHSEYWR